MSQNNTIRKSDKKFIRTEKARIRSQFLDIKKQDELINNLYKKFIPSPKGAEINAESHGNEKAQEPKKIEAKKEAKKSTTKKETKKETKKSEAK